MIDGQPSHLMQSTPVQPAPLAPGKPAREATAERKNKRSSKQQNSSDFIFAIGKDEKDGLPNLTQKFSSEGDAILAAYRGNSDYYKLQKCKVAVVINGGYVTLKTTVDEREANKAA
jgi:hypothetical protein